MFDDITYLMSACFEELKHFYLLSLFVVWYISQVSSRKLKECCELHNTTLFLAVSKGKCRYVLK